MPRPRTDLTNLRYAAEQFLSHLDERYMLHPDVFWILEEEARKRGYTIAAEQHGIRGTFIHFVLLRHGG